MGWLVAAAALVALSLVVFTAGRYGRGISLTVLDEWVLERLAALSTPGLTRVMQALAGLLGSIWTLKVLGWVGLIVLVATRRFRHLIVAFISVESVSLLAIVLSAVVRRPRPFGAAIEGGWAGWAMPSRPVAYLASFLVALIYSLIPEGRLRQTGKLVATGLVALLALASMYLGVDHPSDVLVGAAVGVTIPLLAFRWFVPNEVFPVRYRRGRSAHLDVGGQRGEAIRRALQDQLGLVIEEVEPFGLAGSAGSTPMWITVKGDPPTHLFGKLYARNHLRSDRWYKLGRELRDESRDLYAEFVRLLPTPPQPIRIQRWSARRVGLALFAVLGHPLLRLLGGLHQRAVRRTGGARTAAGQRGVACDRVHHPPGARTGAQPALRWTVAA